MRETYGGSGDDDVEGSGTEAPVGGTNPPIAADGSGSGSGDEAVEGSGTEAPVGGTNPPRRGTNPPRRGTDPPMADDGSGSGSGDEDADAEPRSATSAPSQESTPASVISGKL